MIHTLSAHLPSAGATERSSLVEELTRRVDANRDGEVTSAEFANFLSALTQSLDDEQAAARGTADPSAPTVPAGPAPADAAPMTPAQAAHMLRQAFEPVTRSR